jgi:hypothetical protein
MARARYPRVFGSSAAKAQSRAAFAVGDGAAPPESYARWADSGSWDDTKAWSDSA